MFPFNIRVYGILINDRGEVLLSDEFRNGFSFTKFPGGGLEFGEGFREALKREFMEELNLEIEVGDVFYFNEFHQPSAFDPRHQLHSFYYFVQTENVDSITAGEHEEPHLEEGEKYRWVQIDMLSDALFTFPIDKLVAEKLRQKA